MFSWSSMQGKAQGSKRQIIIIYNPKHPAIHHLDLDISLIKLSTVLLHNINKKNSFRTKCDFYSTFNSLAHITNDFQEPITLLTDTNFMSKGPRSSYILKYYTGP